MASASAAGAQNSNLSSLNPNAPYPQKSAAKPSYSAKLASADTKPRMPDSTASRQAPRGAWQSGVNPITNSMVQQNGAASPSSHSSSPSASLLKEGFKVKITLDSGAEFEGTYSAVTDSAYTLKNVTQKKLPAGAELSADITNGLSRSGRDQPMATKAFQKKDVVDLCVMATALPPKASVRSQNGTASAFRTDSAISSTRFQNQRPLQPWVPDAPEEADTSLESSRNKSSSSGHWDQFAENERLFGLKSNYDETIYTTAIDESHPDYPRRRALAEKMAREIEGSTAMNSHVAEERVVNNLGPDNGGLDEEDRYSGVRRQQDFPPLGGSSGPSAPRENRYMPPAKRPPTGHSTVSGAPVDPAIISSQLARPAKETAEKGKSVQTKAGNIETAKSETPSEGAKAPAVETKAAPVQAPKPVPAQATSSTSQKATPSVRTEAASKGAPNATATVERDVASAFKGFAAQQRQNVHTIRTNRLKADKEVKLNDLKKFASSFKLNTPVPVDLVSIIAKDPAKQREIQEKSMRNAEQAKANASQEAAKQTAPAVEAKPPQRSAPSIHAAPSASGRQNISRNAPPNSVPNAPRGASAAAPPAPVQPGRPPHQLGQRLRGVDQHRASNAQGFMPGHDPRQPPTGPSGITDPASFSRRSSGVASAASARLNPNSNEFRPSPFAAAFNPNGTHPSTGSSPRGSVPNVPPFVAYAVHPHSLVHRKQRDPEATLIMVDLDVHVNSIKGEGKKHWDDNGGIRPAFDTPPTWRSLNEQGEPESSSMHRNYDEMFGLSPYQNQTVSSTQVHHASPQVPHQHQLPFHLQQGVHIGQRQSPRQPPIHLNGTQPGHHGPSPSFNGHDDHRMVPSHSAQSYASPRLPPINMAYPSPMNQPAQLAYNQMQYPMAPGGQQMAQFRSYSGAPHFVPPQGPHMAAPVMIQGPPFMGAPQGMMGPAPQMQIYPGGQAQFLPPGAGPPPTMPGATNGYPSPGRAAPMMVSQGSQQGQPMYAMSPAMQYGQPIYAQQQPGQMRPYPQPGQQHFGTSPQQMHQYSQPNRGPNNYNSKNYQSQHGPHQPGPHNSIPSGPQSGRHEGPEDAK